MKNLLSIILVSLLSIIAVSCAGPYTFEDSGSTVNLSVDDVFEIDLETSGTTGYIWKLMNYDTTVVVLVGEPEFKSKDDRIGSAGIKTYKFKTVANGATDLLLVYRKRWEEHEQHPKMFKMKVVVGTMGQILDE